MLTEFGIHYRLESCENMSCWEKVQLVGLLYWALGVNKVPLLPRNRLTQKIARVAMWYLVVRIGLAELE